MEQFNHPQQVNRMPKRRVAVAPPRNDYVAQEQAPQQMQHMQHAQHAQHAQHMQHMPMHQEQVPFSSVFNPVLTFDYKEVLRRIIKYLLEGIAVGASAHFVGRNKLDIKEILMIGITASLVFAILDMYSPIVSFGARTGTGFALGYGIANSGNQGAQQLIPPM